MVLVHQLQEPIEDILALLLSETIDMPHVTTDGKDTLPSCDRVGPNHWMDCLKLASNILRSSSWLIVQREAAPFSHIVEGWLRESCAQCLQEALIWLADSVIELITRCP